VVVHSSQLDERKAKRLSQEVETEAKMQQDLVRDAIVAMQANLHACKVRFHHVSGTVVYINEELYSAA